MQQVASPEHRSFSLLTLELTPKSYYRARCYDPTTGRFLNEDPTSFSAGINFYAYAGNGPSNFKDPFGLDYTTYRSAVVPAIFVNASITIYGPGATNALAAKWQKAILELWNNNPGYGKCDVIFNVQVIADPKIKAKDDWQAASTPSGFAGANNYIYVPDGSPTDLGNPKIDGGLSALFGQSRSTGTIPSGTGLNSVQHEFGHLLGLFDSNFGGFRPWFLRPTSDIMNEAWTVSAYDINRIIGGGKAPTCGCQ
jgi:RHS repeat-associated protein